MHEWPGGLTIEQLVAGFRARAFSPIEVIEGLADVIEPLDAEINAFAHLCLDGARRGAQDATRRIMRGDARQLEGVPFVAKDLLDTECVPTTCGSRVYADRVPSCDSVAVARLKRAGAILLGKTTTHEFGWGVTTTSDRARPTRNPWSSDRVAGGSSGGSAAAVATGLAPLALGTDTAGSIRIPADFCGVVGLRPGRHVVARCGAFPLAPSLDVVGPIARTPNDVAIALGALTGRAVRRPWRPARDLSGMRIGLAAGVASQLAEPIRTSALAQTAAAAERLGAEVVPIADDDWPDGVEAMASIVLTEGLLTHRTRGLWPGRRVEYGPDVRSHLERADALPATRYRDAIAASAQLADATVSAFDRVDLMLSLSSGTGPAAIDVDPLDADFRKRAMTFTAPQSLAGLPACNIRAGFDSDGLPIGVQLTGPVGAEVAVLDLACELHAATGDVQRVQPAIAARCSGLLPAKTR